MGLGKDGLPKAWGQILPCHVGLNKPLNLREPGVPYLGNIYLEVTVKTKSGNSVPYQASEYRTAVFSSD